MEADGDRAFGTETTETIPFATWPHLMELADYWQTHTREEPHSQVVLKARQLGVSTLAEAYALYVSQERGGNVLVISKTLDDSKDFGAKTLLIYDSQVPDDKRETTIRNTEQLAFRGGGRIIFRAPTEHAGRSQANTLVIVDEAAFQVWAAKNYKAYRPTISAGGQLLVISTANGASGFFYDLFWGAKRRTLPYQAAFIPWSARPDRDERWLAAERAAFSGSPEDFNQEYPSTIQEAFLAKTGRVFPQFVEERHMLTHDPVPWEDCVYRVVSGDYGGGDPTALVVWGVYKSPAGYKMHAYDLYYRTTGAPTIEEMVGFLAPWHARAPITIGQMEHDAIINASLTNLFKDERTKRGPNFLPADKRRGPGLGLVAQFLEQTWVTFNAEKCEPVIYEMQTYRWLERTDPNDKERYATATPVDHHGDILDATRYAIIYVYYTLMAKGDGQRKEGPRAHY